MSLFWCLIVSYDSLYYRLLSLSAGVSKRIYDCLSSHVAMPSKPRSSWAC